MELLDRYLQSVKLMLPRKQQDDVVRELSDEILSQVEEKETALGRPLTEDEQVAMLKQLGHPMMLAARYRKQQYLIGPAVFPIYWMVLRLVLVLVLFGMAIASVVVAATGRGLGAALGILGQYPFGAISAFAWVTVVFALMEFFQARFNLFAKWDPRTLPKLSKAERKNSTSESAAGLFLGAVFGVWWLVGLKHQFLIFWSGIAFMHFGPVFQTLYPLFVVLVLADIIRHTIVLLRPGWEKGRVAFRFLFRAMNLVVLYVLINASDLLVVSDATDPKLQTAIKGLNRGLQLALVMVAIVTVAQIAWEVYNLLGRRAENGTHAAVNL